LSKLEINELSGFGRLENKNHKRYYQIDTPSNPPVSGIISELQSMRFAPLQPFHRQHQQYGENHQEECISRRVPWKPEQTIVGHSANILPSHTNALCPENDPPEYHQEKG
jgi:hypothetical protein